MAGVAAGLLAAAAYAVVLLLPAQSWVLAAADSYAHFATLPVGLWTLAALIELAERSLPSASLRPIVRAAAPAQTNPDAERFGHRDANPVVPARRHEDESFETGRDRVVGLRSPRASALR